MIILTNGIVIELYDLCCESQHESIKLVTKCVEKIFSDMEAIDFINQSPLIASCIKVICRKSLYNDHLSKNCIQSLTDFLIKPSPCLYTLNEKLIISKQNNTESNFLKTYSIYEDSNDEIESKNFDYSINDNYDVNLKIKKVFFFLRELAIKCLSL